MGGLIMVMLLDVKRMWLDYVLWQMVMTLRFYGMNITYYLSAHVSMLHTPCCNAPLFAEEVQIDYNCAITNKLSISDFITER